MKKTFQEITRMEELTWPMFCDEVARRMENIFDNCGKRIRELPQEDIDKAMAIAVESIMVEVEQMCEDQEE